MALSDFEYLLKLSNALRIRDIRRLTRILLTSLFVVLVFTLLNALLGILKGEEFFRLPLSVYDSNLQHIAINAIVIILSICLTILLFTLSSRLWAALSRFRNGFYHSLGNHVRDWVFQGTLEELTSREALFLTNSDAGAYIRGGDWRNVVVEFDAAAANESGFGIIYRARNLECYHMFRLTPGAPIGYYYRETGGWQILERIHDPENPHTSNVDIKPKTWDHYEMTIIGERVRLSIGSQKFSYNIPNDIILNRRMYSLSVDPNFKADNRLITLPNTYKHGSFGFRAFGNEGVMFKNVIIRGKDGLNVFV